MDDITLYTVTNDPSDVKFQKVVNTVLTRSGENQMKISSKTKERLKVVSKELAWLYPMRRLN